VVRRWQAAVLTRISQSREDLPSRRLAGQPALAGRAQATATGLPALPEVPTVVEHGYEDFETSQWYGVLVPAATPREVIKRLQEEALKALRSSSVTERFASDSAVGGGGPPEGFAAYIAEQQRKRKPIVLRAGIKPD
jgi:tripartite-type tricarboxylate transporter receptor subunit TctC